MEFILKTTPAERRTLLFSATLPRGIVALAKQYQQQAFRVEVEGGAGGHADIEYRALRIAPSDVEHAVVNVLRFVESPSTIVFCNTRNAVKHLQTSLLERGFSVVALSGELTQNERTTALNSLRDGRARVCVATDVAARGIDLPNLDLVIHADLPNDAEVMQHRSGRTGRAGRKGVSVLLVPPARKRRAELLLQLAGIEAVWAVAPSADEIKVLDQQRMLSDALFAEEASEDDLVLARALLAERSAEQVAAALARLYRARLPSPEDILDASDRGARSRDTRAPAREPRPARGDARPPRFEERDGAPRPHKGKPSAKHGMPEGSVWFRAAIGRKKNAEARWLLPMICRRGGIDKHEIGAIRIMDTTTEFEISASAAESFAALIKRPDKEDNIRIEAIGDAPREAEPRFEKPVPRHEAMAVDASGAGFRDPPREHAPKRKPEGYEPRAERPRAKPFDFKSGGDKPAGFKPRGDGDAPFRKTKPHQAGADKPRDYANASKKKKQKKNRG
jgi:ATP-dependent RNA helicase DeaD